MGRQYTLRVLSSLHFVVAGGGVCVVNVVLAGVVSCCGSFSIAYFRVCKRI